MHRALVFALFVMACDHAPRGIDGVFLSTDGRLLLDASGGARARLVVVLGDGECDALTTGDIEGREIHTDDGVVLTVRHRGDALLITEPSGLLDGTFTPAVRAEHCYTLVPAPTRLAANVVELAPGPVVTMPGLGRTRAVVVDPPPDTETFALYLIGEGVGFVRARPLALLDASSRDVLEDAPDRIDCQPTSCTVVLHKVPDASVGAPPYTFLYGGSPELEQARVFLATRPIVPPPVGLRLHVVLGPTDRDEAVVVAALEAFVATYEAEGLSLTEDPLVRSSEDVHRAVSLTFLAAHTQSLFAMGEPDAINVFIVDDLYDGEGIYGAGSGVTGTLGVVGPWNGVLVSLTTHDSDDPAEVTRLLAETLAHEVGHLLGLYHTTEASGAIFDPLADTPECDVATYDADGDGEVLADECEGAGGDNVMFWTPSVSSPPVIPQGVWSSDQRRVLEGVVIGR